MDVASDDVAVLDGAAVDTGADTSAVDANAVDTGADTSAVDANAFDTNAVDAGTLDIGTADVGPVDAGTIDTGTVDAGAVDTGPRDGGASDARSPDVTCASALASCGGTCADLQTDGNHCGVCGRACAATTDGGVTCVGGACVAVCPVGSVDAGVPCVVLPPRQVAPISAATVTSQTPTLRWVLAGGDGASVRLCRNRAMTATCVTYTFIGARGAPGVALTPGVWFWQLTARAGDATAGPPGPVWEFTVGARAAPTDTSWGTNPDINGDGFADVIIGAPGSDSAYIYLGAASGLGTMPTRLNSPGSNGHGFGWQVASAGDINGDGMCDVVIGTHNADTAYVYLAGAGGLGAIPTPLTGPGGTEWGSSVASAGDVNGDGYADVVIGNFNNRPVSVYLGGATGLDVSATLLLAMGDRYGSSVASAGDVNGDSYSDLIVGAFGAASFHVYLGSPTGLITPPTTLSGTSGSNFGYSVASAGDVNGDGYSDVVVGAAIIGAAPPTAYVYLGSATGLMRPPTTLAIPSSAARTIAISVASAGDVNGDGYSDVVVGSNGRDAAYVFLGSSSGMSATPITLTAAAGSYFGQSVASAGDVDGDGYADVVVGGQSASEAYVHRGSAAGPNGIRTTLVAPSGSNLFGASVASAGAFHGADPQAPSVLDEVCRVARRRAGSSGGPVISPAPGWRPGVDRARNGELRPAGELDSPHG